MPWLRIVIALLATCLCLASIVIATLQTGARNPADLPSPPGLSAAEIAALDTPYSNLKAGTFDAIIGSFADGIDTSAAQSKLGEMRALLPKSQEHNRRVVRFTRYLGTDGQRLIATQERYHTDHVVRIETTLARASSADRWLIENFHVRVASLTELEALRFTLHNKSPQFIAFIAATVAIPIFNLVTWIAALLWPHQRRRWLWLLLIPLSFSTISMNGADGAMGFKSLSVLFMGSSAFWYGSLFEPWIFSISIPIVGIAFWLTRLVRDGETAQTQGG